MESNWFCQALCGVFFFLFFSVDLCCLNAILVSVQCSSITFSFCPLSFFTDEDLPCFVYAVIIVKTVVLKTPINCAFKVTDAPA